MSNNILNFCFDVPYKNRTIVSACYMKSNEILAITFASDDSISIVSFEHQKVYDIVEDLNALTRSCDIIESTHQDNIKIEYLSSENIFKLVVTDKNSNKEDLYWLKGNDLCLFADWLNNVTRKD